MFYWVDIRKSSESHFLPWVIAQVSTNQKAIDIPEGMVLEEKTPDLLALLTAHTEGNSLVVPVVPRPPMLAPPLPSTSKATEKKRKRGRQSEKESSKKGEIPPTSQQALSRRRALLKGLTRALKGSNALKLPFGILPLCWARRMSSHLRLPLEMPKRADPG